MRRDSLRLLILSDLHAHCGDPNSDKSSSHFSIDPKFDGPTTNPVTSLGPFLKKKGIFANWVIAPGDLGDQANSVAQKAAWEALKAICSDVGATDLIGTVGNHDVDSRRNEQGIDPKSALQQLHPTFPIDKKCFKPDDRVFSDRYWSRNFVVVKYPEWNATVLLLNSCAFHGYASKAKSNMAEHLHGKISNLTLQAIEQEVGKIDTRINILLVHHHLQPNPYDDKDKSLMKGAGRLLEILKSSERHWLVIHGHQHAPALKYCDADHFAPVILSSASVAAKTYEIRGRTPRNQVHLVEISMARRAPAVDRLKGKITSWTWVPVEGWQPATPHCGLPHETGFGERPDLTAAVVMISKAALGGVEWDHILSKNPKLQYITQSDHKALVTLLKQNNVNVQTDDYGRIGRIERKSL